jgi:hypothetical protein
MAKQKRRSDIAKMVTAARDVWRQSETYQAVKKACKSKLRAGWFDCTRCLQLREVIRIDHIAAIGKQPTNWREFGPWLERLNCGDFNLQGICTDCHKVKTKHDKEKRGS